MISVWVSYGRCFESGYKLFYNLKVLQDIISKLAFTNIFVFLIEMNSKKSLKKK
jgi:hypothetical protein